MPVNLLPRPPFNEAGFTIGSAADLSAFYSPLVSEILLCDCKFKQPRVIFIHVSFVSRFIDLSVATCFTGVIVS